MKLTIHKNKKLAHINTLLKVWRIFSKIYNPLVILFPMKQLLRSKVQLRYFVEEP